MCAYMCDIYTYVRARVERVVCVCVCVHNNTVCDKQKWLAGTLNFGSS